jgi:hypothetical protein
MLAPAKEPAAEICECSLLSGARVRDSTPGDPATSRASSGSSPISPLCAPMLHAVHPELGTTRRGHDKALRAAVRFAMSGCEGPPVPPMRGTQGTGWGGLPVPWCRRQGRSPRPILSSCSPAAPNSMSACGCLAVFSTQNQGFLGPSLWLAAVSHAVSAERLPMLLTMRGAGRAVPCWPIGSIRRSPRR